MFRPISIRFLMSVMAEGGEMEVLGAHTVEGLGMAADPVQKRLVPTVMLELIAHAKNSD